MKRLIAAVSAALVLLPLCGAGKKDAPVPKPINIDVVIDSALIMADNYADALLDKPEMAPTRLNVLRNYGSSKSPEVRDSICSRLYDFFVNYTEQDKTGRASAFKKCFISLASPDDPNLGPLYASELIIARENTDTAAIKEYMPLLKDYAARMGYDYDEELAAARDFLYAVRNRRPIDEELVGVWVSDEMLKYPFPATIYGFSVGKAFNVMGGSSYGAAVRDIEIENAIMTLNIIAFSRTAIHQLVSLGDKKYGFVALQKDECPKYGFSVDDTCIKEKSRKRNAIWYYNTIETRTDNNSRWLYGIWGTEQLKRNDAELTAALRQSIQHTQALVAGQFSRSQYSFGEELVANTLASGFSAITNGIISHFSVSKDKIYSAEVNLQLQHPYKLVGRLDIINVEVRSDRETPTVKERNAEVSYYRWAPEDNVFFLTPFETYVPLYEPSKSENERMKRIVRQAKAYWKEHKSGKWFYQWFNEQMFTKLKNRAGEGAVLTKEVWSLLEI